MSWSYRLLDYEAAKEGLDSKEHNPIPNTTMQLDKKL
jgi:hypothetical protein